MFNRQYREGPQCGIEAPQCGLWPFSPHRRGDDEAKEEVDALLAQSMSQLSFRDRQRGQEDLHGVSADIIEDMDQMEIWLQELHSHLNVFKRGTVYETAETMNSSYVSDRDFRIMFLRSNRYDAKASAHQLIRFFDTKLRLFGKDKLVHDITLNDLDDDDRACVQNGSRQILPWTDSAQRPILIELPGLRSFKSLDNEMRARFYIFMSVLESQEAQIRGVVVLIYAVGRFRDNSNGVGNVENTKLGLAVPMYYAGLHFCSDALSQYILSRTAIAVMPPKIRARFKVHLGSHLECQYLVSSYGISREDLILATTDNAARLDTNLLWYKKRYTSEVGADLPQNLMSMPNLPRVHYDVLFGRKKNHHPGNKVLYLRVKRHSEAYDTASRSRKRELTDELVGEIQATGGRFLKQVDDSDRWEEVSTEEAQEKVAQAFRNIRRPRAKLIKIETPQNGAAGELFSHHGPNDVLFGRVRSNVGNRRVRELVGDLSEEYDSATKVRKRQLADSVVQEVKRTGARFLKQREDDRWEEVSDDFARTKISKHFSNNRRYSQKL